MNRIKAAYHALVAPLPTGLGAFHVMVDKETGRFAVEEELGDGKAEFLGEGTEAEYLDQQREDEGSKAWYERLARLGKEAEHDGGNKTA